MQNPAMDMRSMIAPIAIPIFAPSVRPLLGVYTPVGVGVGEVMLTGVVEKSEPWMEMVLPGVGCCIHAAFRAVRTVN
jgi:hypothetical protein